LAFKFRLGLVDFEGQKAQESRLWWDFNVLLFRVFQKWPEDELPKCEIIFPRALSGEALSGEF
jgi:hypothetical protein